MDSISVVAPLTAAAAGLLMAGRFWRHRRQQRLAGQLRVSKETVARLRRIEDATSTS
jgi:hypothetical protein